MNAGERPRTTPTTPPPQLESVWAGQQPTLRSELRGTYEPCPVGSLVSCTTPGSRRRTSNSVQQSETSMPTSAPQQLHIRLGPAEPSGRQQPTRRAGSTCGRSSTPSRGLITAVNPSLSVRSPIGHPERCGVKHEASPRDRGRPVRVMLPARDALRQLPFRASEAHRERRLTTLAPEDREHLPPPRPSSRAARTLQPSLWSLRVLHHKRTRTSGEPRGSTGKAAESYTAVGRLFGQVSAQTCRKGSQLPKLRARPHGA
ncbi:hypothetical protein M2158_003899 [Streptomyces sp. SAI-144]|nr:hypothetical protein [Streptomyces sp. SAI-144]